MTNSSVKQFAEELSDIYMKIEDCKAEAAALIETAKEADVDVKALRKVAKEMVMMSDKLAAKYEAEQQLDMFRAQVGIFSLKGLDETEKAANAARVVGEKELVESARAFDAVAGTNIGGEYVQRRGQINRHFAKRAAE